MTAAVERLPWEKAPGETGPAWAAFVLYRDLGPERSQSKVCKATGKDRAQIARWSMKHHWVDRVDEYDAYLDRRRTEATAESWRIANAAHRSITNHIRSAVQAKLEGDEAREITPLNPDDLDWADIARLTRDVITLERLVHGQPTDFAARVISIDVNQAVDHVRTLVDLARKHMDEEQFRAFILDYRSVNALALEQARSPRQIGP